MNVCPDFTCITECHGPLGMQSGDIEDWQITARPFRDYRFRPSPGRLRDATGGAGEAWKPSWFYRHPWFQVRLHNGYTWVTGIATQGRVTTYALLYWDYIVRMQWYTERGQTYAKVKKIVRIILLNQKTQKIYFAPDSKYALKYFREFVQAYRSNGTVERKGGGGEINLSDPPAEFSKVMISYGDVKISCFMGVTLLGDQS